MALPPDSELLERHGERLARQMRHDSVSRHAIEAERFRELRDGLLSAASRFEDLADIIEKDRAHDPVNFMRASADRYRRLAEDA